MLWWDRRNRSERKTKLEVHTAASKLLATLTSPSVPSRDDIIYWRQNSCRRFPRKCVAYINRIKLEFSETVELHICQRLNGALVVNTFHFDIWLGYSQWPFSAHFSPQPSVNACILDQKHGHFHFRQCSTQKLSAKRFMTQWYYIICLKNNAHAHTPTRKWFRAAAWRKRHVRCRHKPNAHNALWWTKHNLQAAKAYNLTIYTTSNIGCVKAVNCERIEIWPCDAD